MCFIFVLSKVFFLYKLELYLYLAIFLISGNTFWIHPLPNYRYVFNIFLSCAAFIVSVWLITWMSSLAFVYVFWFGLLVFMSCVNYFIEKNQRKEDETHTWYWTDVTYIKLPALVHIFFSHYWVHYDFNMVFPFKKTEGVASS